jgi:ABC-type sugar transport system substrate-binding protein
MLLLIAIIAISSFSSKARSIDVTYISQTRDLTPYWSNTYAVAKAAAKDLNINLTIVEGQGHHLYQAEVLAELVLSKKKPDLLIFHAYKQNAYKYFDSLEHAQIPFITYSNFTDAHTLPTQKQLGRPQGKYKYWLSEHHVENAQGAALLVDSLIKQAKNKLVHSNKKLKVLALSGDLILQSLERSTGVAAQVSDIDNVILVQDIIANWSAEDARNKFKKLYVRHKGIDVVWASSDVMAIGALNGAMELGLVPNKDIFIGGFDWNRDAINKIKAKELGASAGGQFYHIAWLLVQVYDHFNNQSPFAFKQKSNNTYAIIDQDNLSKFEGLTDINNLDDINFYCFTKTYTRQKKYNFSMLNLLHQSNRSNKPNCK